MLRMCEDVRGDVGAGHCDSIEEFNNANVEDIKPVYEEITTMKTEVIEECYDYGILNSAEPADVKPFSTSECFQLVTHEHPTIPSYDQTLKNDCYKQHIVLCKEEKDIRLIEDDVAVKDEKKYVCDKCSYITKYKCNFQRHTLIHGGEKLFKCKTCGNSFRQKDDLKIHARVHDNERQKDVHCPYCNKTYYTNAPLQRHIDVKHACKRYNCKLCDYTTSYKYFLKRHEQMKHGDGVKLYKCKYCEHSTHYKVSLRNHERTHSNDMLLKCTYKNCMCKQQCVSNTKNSCHCDPCQFGTAYRNSLRRHILVKHSAKPERYRCTVCTYSTHFQRYLRDHMRIHMNEGSPKKYKCEYCDHTTHWKGNLKKHILIHRNEKIFKCAYINCKCGCVGEKPCDCEPCNYETVHENALKGHILRKHSEEAKKYICAHCGYCTNIRESLKRHLLHKHSNAKSVPVENS